MQAGLIVLALFGIIGLGAYFYYTTTQAELKQLTADNVMLVAIQEQNAHTIGGLQEDIAVAAEDFKEITIKYNQSEDYQDMLIAKLQKHDLTRLTAEKPGLIERRVNDATKKVLEDMESSTNK
jgi:preprotein translocase subunit YajC